MTASGKPSRPRFPVSLARVVPPARPVDAQQAQRQLADAARDARRGVPPWRGVGSDNAAVRLRMVERLQNDGVRDARVLHAMLAVPRHLFVDSGLSAQAYEDTSLPIGLGQTISKPSVVARMMEWLLLGTTARQCGHLGRVLEIGTGCGYQAAVLAQLAQHVVSLERLEGLHQQAAHRLTQPGLVLPAPCHLVFGDGMLGAPEHAPFDSIIAAAGGEELPTAWLEQLAMGGRLVAPARAPGGGQALMIVDRTPHGWQQVVGEAVQFVPLKSGIA